MSNFNGNYSPRELIVSSYKKYQRHISFKNVLTLTKENL